MITLVAVVGVAEVQIEVGLVRLIGTADDAGIVLRLVAGRLGGAESAIRRERDRVHRDLRLGDGDVQGSQRRETAARLG